MASGKIRIEVPVKSKDDGNFGMLALFLPTLLRLAGIRTKATIAFVPDLPEGGE